MRVVGIGLNKTGTKTLGNYLRRLGFQHCTFDREAFEMYRRGDIDGVLERMTQYDSFEDWPWPLLFREIDARFPGARFVLTVRKNADVWYRSLCNMAVRMGPFNEFEKYIYGHAMPQGHRDEHIRIYEEHNRAVAEHFADRPHKLLTLCWEHGDTGQKLVNFLDVKDAPELPTLHINRSSQFVYGGDNLMLAQISRYIYQSTLAHLWRSIDRTLRSVYRTRRMGLRSTSHPHKR